MIALYIFHTSYGRVHRQICASLIVVKLFVRIIWTVIGSTSTMSHDEPHTWRRGHGFHSTWQCCISCPMDCDRHECNQMTCEVACTSAIMPCKRRCHRSLCGQHFDLIQRSSDADYDRHECHQMRHDCHQWVRP